MAASSWDRTGRQWLASAAPALAWAGIGVPFDVVSMLLTWPRPTAAMNSPSQPPPLPGAHAAANNLDGAISLVMALLHAHGAD